MLNDEIDKKILNRRDWYITQQKNKIIWNIILKITQYWRL